MTWTKAQIQQARKIPLAPILRHRGVILHEFPGDNYRVEGHNDLFIKDSYWIWKSQNLHGNTIDYLIFVEKMSFSQAMSLLNPS